MRKATNRDYPLLFPRTIRKVIRLGHSYAITLPPTWLRDQKPTPPVLIDVQTNADGSLTLTAFPKPDRPPSNYISDP
jgi:hypothetical protein